MFFSRFIKSVENKFVSWAALGEGWHNYHHVFPWDYRTSELGLVNWSTAFIDTFAKIGWAYDCTYKIELNKLIPFYIKELYINDLLFLHNLL